MPPAPSTLQSLLRRLVLRLVMMLGGWLDAAAGRLRARLDAMPRGHRPRARLEREMAKVARYQAMLADPDFWDDPRVIGMAAEVARVRNDAGRRALARRMLCPNLFFALPEARPAPRATLEPPEERCTPYIVVI